MLEIKHVTKTYSGKKALDDVTLSIPRGEIIGLFGENGAGKTTLMKTVFGFIPYKGEITLDGEPITTANIAKLSFATCEHSFFPNLTAKGHREFYQEHFLKFSLKRFEGLMEFFELPMNKPIRSFSTGQKNQFEVIMALCQGADYILMDEPFARTCPGGLPGSSPASFVASRLSVSTVPAAAHISKDRTFQTSCHGSFCFENIMLT